MANTKSAKARVLTNQRDQQRNIAIKSNIKTLVKKINSTDNEQIEVDSLKIAVKAIDKAVSKGVLHKNTASRKKSRLMKSLNKKQSA